MGTLRQGRQHLARGTTILLVAMLGITAAATSALAGTYPPNPMVWGDITCQPEELATGDTVTCTVDGLDPESDDTWWGFIIDRVPDGGEEWEAEHVASDGGELSVAGDGTASFTFVVPIDDVLVGDNWVAFAGQMQDLESCYAVVVDDETGETEHLAGPGPLVWLDADGTVFEIDGQTFTEGEYLTPSRWVTAVCDGGFNAFVDGEIVAASTTPDETPPADGTTTPVTPTDGSTTPVTQAAGTLPRTGGNTGLLAAFGALTLLGGVSMLRGPQLLARLRS